MTTTIEIIKNELKENNLPFTGAYERMPLMMLEVINNIKRFGVDAINNSTLGRATKRIALQLAEKDTRELVIINGKTILR